MVMSMAIARHDLKLKKVLFRRVARALENKFSPQRFLEDNIQVWFCL